MILVEEHLFADYTVAYTRKVILKMYYIAKWNCMDGKEMLLLNVPRNESTYYIGHYSLHISR